MNILKAISDEHLFRSFLQDRKGKLSSWLNWSIALRCLYGLPIKSKYNQLVMDCTGRDYGQLPSDGFRTALFLTGRRSGKSKISALIASYEAALSGREKLLSKGETGLVAVVSPSRFQSQVVKQYIRAVFDTPMLAREIVKDYRDGFKLNNGVRIAILTADFRLVRGFSLLAAVCDEAAFLGTDAESKVKSDDELITALKPSLASCNGRLIVISSPYARKGFCWNTYKRYFGKNTAPTLVWNCPSRVMNHTLPQSVVDAALQEDLAAAKSEYLGEFRDDVCIFLPRELIEQYVVKNRFELLPRQGVIYGGFADVSGGRHDDGSISIAHRSDKKIVIDCIKRYRPPHNPNEVIHSMCDVLKSYHIKQAVGDNYSAEFTVASFRSNGIRYTKSELNKSQLFLEFLPALCSGGIELLDDEVLINQLSNLERRIRSGGKDVVCKSMGAKDDIANAVSGVCALLSKPRMICGGGFHFSNGTILHDLAGGNVVFNRQMMALAISQQQKLKGI